jgi:hypothetical protein
MRKRKKKIEGVPPAAAIEAFPRDRDDGNNYSFSSAQADLARWRQQLGLPPEDPLLGGAGETEAFREK